MLDNEMVDISIGTGGRLLPVKNSNIALIDADTIIFAACTMVEYMECLMDRADYTDLEWEDLVSSEGYSEADNCVYNINLDEAEDHVMDKIQQILDNTGCIDWELHFTAGRTSFRYNVLPTYKDNRKGGRAPVGNYRLKKLLSDKYPDKSFIWYNWEADDMVVSLKRDNKNKYTLCAVDKDVLYSLAGTHFNYYQSKKYNIEMKWIEVSDIQAMKHHYGQAITGDTTDGIIGIKGIGPKTCEKILSGLTTDEEMWEAVQTVYRNNKRDIVDALLNMRLVSMHQLEFVNDKYEVKLWKPL